DAAAPAAHAAPERAARAVREGASAAAPRTVLLAEDDHGVRRVSARILRAAGYRVLEAGDGAGALELLREHGDAVDAVLADVRMPRLGGEALARVVGAEFPGPPVVVITGGARDPRHDRPPAGAVAPPAESR